MKSIIASSKRMAPLFLLAALTGCGTASIYAPDHVVDDLYSFLNYGAPEGEAQLDIYGNPFAGPTEELAAALLKGFEGGVNYGPPLTFSTHSASARPGYRFVVAFGAPPATTGDDLCRKKASALALSPKDHPFRLKAAYCVETRAFSEASGQSGAISSPQDPDFGRWAWHLMQALTPPPIKRPDRIVQ